MTTLASLPDLLSTKQVEGLIKSFPPEAIVERGDCIIIVRTPAGKRVLSAISAGGSLWSVAGHPRPRRDGAEAVSSVTNEQLLTTAQAVRLVKQAERTRGTRLMLRVRIDTPIDGEPDKVFRDGAFGSVELSKAQALKLVSTMLSPGLEKRGARIRVSSYDRTEGDILRNEAPIYWIG
jgi:hypothetical protein